MKPYTLLKFIETNKLHIIAKKFFPKGIKSNISREQLMTTLNSKVIATEKEPLEIYLKHISINEVKKNQELKKVLNLLVQNSESKTIIELAKQLLNANPLKDNKIKVKDYVYLLHEKINKTTKIGYTKNVNRRLTEFKVDLPYPVDLIHTIECVKGREVEKLLHQHFKSKRVGGEWFHLSIDDIANIKKRNLPEKILAMITGENMSAFTLDQPKKTKANKVPNKNTSKAVSNKNLKYERSYDEYNRTRYKTVSFDENIHSTGRSSDYY